MNQFKNRAVAFRAACHSLIGSTSIQYFVCAENSPAPARIDSHIKIMAMRLIVCCFLVALPQYARANAGTPLMMTEILHLFFGNALIGLGEGLLLARLFSLPRGKAIFIMVLANYASAWLGRLLLRSSIVQDIPIDINNGWIWLWVMVGVTYCMTLAIEWPFIGYCLRRNKNWLWQSARASLIVQSASYLLILGGYGMVSRVTLFTDVNIVPISELSLPDSVLVYFISPKDGNVYSRPLKGGIEQKIFDLDSKNQNDRLFARPSANNTPLWDLVARLNANLRGDQRLVEVLTRLNVDAASERQIDSGTEPANYERTWFNFGPVQRVKSAINDQWEFRSGFWPSEGLRASNKSTGGSVRFAYETPFGSWAVRNAVQLPTNKVIFQLGMDQICVFDPETRRVALLWHGRGPVPVIERH